MIADPAPVPVSVGLLNEGHLHASLRARYVGPGDRVEVRVDGYIVDVLRADTIVEVQTANFSAIARKVRDLVTRHRVRLVYPVPHERWIVKLPQQPGDAATRRKSPKHPAAIDVFCELVSFPELIGHPNFELDVALVREETVWRHEGGGRRAWRRRGWVTIERRLLDVVETLPLRAVGDYAALLPASLPAEFLTSDLALAIRRPRRVAQQVAYCLRHAGCIEKVGARGNAAVYARSKPKRRSRGGAARRLTADRRVD